MDYNNATLSGLPDYQYRRLQSVINVAVRLIYSLWWSDHVTPALMELHWLNSVDRVNFKVATLVCHYLNDLAPPYMSASLNRIADIDSQRRLRSSADTDILLIPRFRLVTVGIVRVVTRPRTWNNLLETVRSTSLLPLFKWCLKLVFSRRYWHS